MSKKSVAVIPAYNAASTIGEVVKRTSPFVDLVIVVDDGSIDETASEAKRHGARVISLDENTGKSNAAKVGIRECAGFGAVVMLDSDLQHCPEEIPHLITEVENGTDLCIGSRFLNGHTQMPFGNMVSNRVASQIISLITGHMISDPQSGFRALDGRIAQDLDLAAERYAIEHVMILEAAKKDLIIKEVPISCIYGDEESHIRVIPDTIRVIRDILKFVLK
jgi:glycosyltransferase involved in cell wall biosynthesis